MIAAAAGGHHRSPFGGLDSDWRAAHFRAYVYIPVDGNGYSGQCGVPLHVVAHALSPSVRLPRSWRDLGLWTICLYVHCTLAGGMHETAKRYCCARSYRGGCSNGLDYPRTIKTGYRHLFAADRRSGDIYRRDWRLFRIDRAIGRCWDDIVDTDHYG